MSGVVFMVTMPNFSSEVSDAAAVIIFTKKDTPRSRNMTGFDVGGKSAVRGNTCTVVTPFPAGIAPLITGLPTESTEGFTVGVSHDTMCKLSGCTQANTMTKHVDFDLKSGLRAVARALVHCARAALEQRASQLNAYAGNRRHKPCLLCRRDIA